MEAWQQEQARRNAAKPPPKIKEIQMRKKIEESIPKEDSMEDVDDRIDRREATWRRIIEEATPIERATLNAMSRNDKEALIDAREEKSEGDGGGGSVHERSLPLMNLFHSNLGEIRGFFMFMVNLRHR
jgi:hypothetical protein